VAGSRSSIPYSAEFLSSPSCTKASTSPMTPPSRPTNATAETRLSLVALHAKGHAYQVTFTAAGSPRTSWRARLGAPNATIRWGRPMLPHAATLLLSVGDIMGFNSPEQFTSHSPLPVDGGERKLRLHSLPPLSCTQEGTPRTERPLS
jgi:hypothetical protein